MGHPPTYSKLLEGLDKGDLSLRFSLRLSRKVLVIFFVKVKDVRLLKSFQAGHNGKMITHLQFLNDIVLFCSAKWEELLVIKMILRCFELSLGLKINLVKSLLVGFDCQDELLASNLSCKVGKLPLIIYLG